jgi:F-box and WD-40 domain protein 7
MVLEDHTRPVLCLAISNGHLYSGSYDYSIKARLSKLKVVWLAGPLRFVVAAHYLCSACGASCTLCVPQVWELSTLSRIRTLFGHTDAVRALAAVSGRLFSASYDATVRVWSESEYTCEGVLKGHSGPVRALAVADVGSGPGLALATLFSGSYDKTVRAWDVSTLRCRGVLRGHTSAVRALVATATHVFSGSDDASVRCWDAASLACVRVLSGHTDNVRVLTIGGGFLFSGSWDRTVRAWSLRSLDCVAVLEGHTEAVLALAVTEACCARDDGSSRQHAAVLVSGSYDTSVRMWRLGGDWRCVRHCAGHADAVRVLAAAPIPPSTVAGTDRTTWPTAFSGSYDGSIGVW